MSLLASLLGSASQNIPDPAVERYNSLLKTGSWVLSGAAEYKRWSDDNFARLKNYLDRYFNFERDPQKALWLVNMLSRNNPVKIPDYMSSDEWSGLQKLWNEWVRGRDQGLPDGPSSKDRSLSYAIPGIARSPKKDCKAEDAIAVNRSRPYEIAPTTKQVIKGTIGFSRLDNIYGSNDEGSPAKYYSDFYSAYGAEKVSASNPADMVKTVVDELGVTIGYKNYYGFEPGSDHSWDIKISPYYPPNLRDATTGAPTDKDWSFVPELPKYKLPKGLVPGGSGGSVSEGSEGSEGSVSSVSDWFSFGDNCPCMQYNIQFGNQLTKDIKLYNGSQFMIPVGFGYNINIGLDILDDVHGSMKSYMNKYLNEIYSLKDASVARYDKAAFRIDLVVFKPGYIPKVMFGFIAVPVNYSPVYDGQNTPNEESIHIDFSVIGMVTMNSSTQINTPPTSSDDWKSTNWTQVTLSAKATE